MGDNGCVVGRRKRLGRIPLPVRPGTCVESRISNGGIPFHDRSGARGRVVDQGEFGHRPGFPKSLDLWGIDRGMRALVCNLDPTQHVAPESLVMGLEVLPSSPDPFGDLIVVRRHRAIHQKEMREHGPSEAVPDPVVSREVDVPISVGILRSKIVKEFLVDRLAELKDAEFDREIPPKGHYGRVRREGAS